jgi:hypothetical protein
MKRAADIAAAACILALAAGCSSSAQAGPTSTTAPRAISLSSRFCAEVPAIRALYRHDNETSITIAFARLESVSPPGVRADVATIRDLVKLEATSTPVRPSNRELMKYTRATLRVQAYAKELCGVGPMPERDGHPLPGGHGWTTSF